jgi:hypothetical protein
MDISPEVSKSRKLQNQKEASCKAVAAAKVCRHYRQAFGHSASIHLTIRNPDCQAKGFAQRISVAKNYTKRRHHERHSAVFEIWH